MAEKDRKEGPVFKLGDCNTLTMTVPPGYFSAGMAYTLYAENNAGLCSALTVTADANGVLVVTIA